MNKNSWFSIVNYAEADTASISIYSEIGMFGVTLDDFAAQFKEIKDRKDITLYLNSPGGDVFAGIGIYNLLSTVRENLTIEVIGLAASIASVIALAGSRRVMNSGSLFMIHNPALGMFGSSDELRKNADLLDKIKAQVIEIYQEHTTLSAEELATMMDNESWLSPEEALKYGFATEINKQEKAVACLYNLETKGFKHIPKNLARPQVSLTEMNVREFESFLRDVGLSRQDALMVASKSGLGMKQESEPPTPTEIEVLEEIRKLFI